MHLGSFIIALKRHSVLREPAFIKTNPDVARGSLDVQKYPWGIFVHTRLWHCRVVVYMQTQTIKTCTFEMEYFRFGHGKEALVILPGLSVQSVMCFADAVAQAYKPLTDDFSIFVLDRRKDLPPTYSVRDMASDTAAALQELGLDRICLMGASQGGMIAMEVAAEHPGLVRKLVLCSTSACMTQDRFAVVEKWIELAKAGDAAGLYSAFGEAIYTQETFEMLRGFLAEGAAALTDDDLARFVTLAEGMKHFDITDDLHVIDCPVLLIGSRDDKILGPDATAQIFERLGKNPQSALHMYDNYGHAAYDTAPDFKERVLRFLLQ